MKELIFFIIFKRLSNFELYIQLLCTVCQRGPNWTINFLQENHQIIFREKNKNIKNKRREERYPIA